MHRSTLVLMLVGAAMAAPCPAAIGDEPGSVAQLYTQCKNMVASMDGAAVSQDTGTMLGVGVCAGYLASFKDAQMFMPHSSPMHACVPNDATVLQLGRVFLKWAGEHPESHHLNRALGVFAAMQQGFSCGDAATQHG